MPTTGEQIFWAQEDLLKVLLPAYIYQRDWKRAEMYFLAKIERVRRNREDFEKKVIELERRVSLVKAKVVALETA